MTASPEHDRAPAGALDRKTLYHHTLAVLNRGSRRNPDVSLVEVGGRKLVVKDFEPRGPWVKATIGRRITSREIRAYRAEGVRILVLPEYFWVRPEDSNHAAVSAHYEEDLEALAALSRDARPPLGRLPSSVSHSSLRFETPRLFGRVLSPVRFPRC